MKRFLSSHDLPPIQEDEAPGAPSLPHPPRRSAELPAKDTDLIIPYQNYFDYKKTVTINDETFSYY